MSRPEGLPKTGGRKKGTPNKRSKYFNDSMEALGCDPLKILSDLLVSESSLTAQERAQICLTLLQYSFPKRKPVDTSGAYESEFDSIFGAP